MAVGLDADIVLAGEQGPGNERRDPEIRVVYRNAGPVWLRSDLDLPGVDVRAEQLAGGFLHSLDEILHAPFDQPEPSALDLSVLDVVEVQVESELFAARADAACDDAPHAQRNARPAQAGDVVEAILRAPLALDAEPRAELLFARDLEAAVLRHVGDEDLGEIVGQLGILLRGAEDQDRHLFAGARRPRWSDNRQRRAECAGGGFAAGKAHGVASAQVDDPEAPPAG